jgi:exosortase N
MLLKGLKIEKMAITLWLAAAVLIFCNLKIIENGFSNDFFGIVLSILLFVFDSKPANHKIANGLLLFLGLLGFITWQLQTASLHFLAVLILLTILFFATTGRFSTIGFFCLLLFSSIFGKIFDTSTTEIKQFLCKIAYHSLKNFIKIDKIEGVCFYISNKQISIDTACMGLSMLKIGFLFCAYLIVLKQKQQQKVYNYVQIIGLFIISLMLNLLGNYFRIVILVLMGCTTNNLLHQAIGLSCFLVYEVVPLILIFRYFKPKNEPILFEAKKHLSKIILSFILLFAMTHWMKQPFQNNSINEVLVKYNFKSGKWIKKDVYRVLTTTEIIYIKKPIHNPLICWTGSGYKILSSQKKLLKNGNVWHISLEKNNKKHLSYWWYECDGETETSFVFVMLKSIFCQKPVWLINRTQLQGN